MNSKGLKLAYFFAILNAVIIGFSFLFTKMALQNAQPLDTLTYRFAASFIVLSIPVAFGWVKLNFRGKPLYKALLLASMYPLGFFTLQTFGLQHATSAEGGILYAFTPVVTMLLASIFLKEATTILQKLSIFLSVFGVVFIFIMKGSSINLSNMTGIFMLFLTCVAFAGYSVLARSLSKQFSPAEITYFMLGIGFVVFLVVSLTDHATSGTLDRFFAPLASGTFIVSILFLGIVSSLVTALTANYILSKMEASKMSVFTNLSTIVSMAAGAMFLGEEVTVYHLIGSVLIIAGVVGTNRLGRKKASESIRFAEKIEA
ncbi:DMT family transporter [Paenibacillus sp. SYP-B3998]|uniref:DMT family transporter n=1 Tax=Paenibacillus sp. SYP-B3998 TaxID=2678564 RepID=A0A6G3ZZU7_9BACL|nr:DMT family transporter [Paenibacillus sp. SYP-B3998]NEW07733.1 DMT family transporter [Paenibacillus sp. SYP-B3998]